MFEHIVIDLRSHLVRKWAKQTSFSGEFSRVHSLVHEGGMSLSRVYGLLIMLPPQWTHSTLRRRKKHMRRDI